jgi:hypothetical protein
MARCDSCGVSLSGSDLHDPFCDTELGNTRKQFDNLKRVKRELELEVERLKSRSCWRKPNLI